MYFLLFLLAGATGLSSFAQGPPDGFPRRVIFDTDANNELDDQHALAYLLLNGDHFDLAAITVNRTQSGGPLADHMAEARRVVELVGLKDQVEVIPGADGSFADIRPRLAAPDFDGAEAVRFIVEEARRAGPEGLLLLPVGKLTNIALALALDPAIAEKVRILWLGSNYPDPGEYNQVNDEEALRYILERDVPFDVALVRYGKPSGTDAVRITPDQVEARLAGLGPRVDPPVEGRHGGRFSCFGDYAVSLFSGIELYGDPPSRALFDLAAVAIAKQPDWARPRVVPAPSLAPDGTWADRPDNPRSVVLWEAFDGLAILDDLVRTLRNPRPVAPSPGGVPRRDGLSDEQILTLYEGLRVADVSDGMDMVGLKDVGLMDPAITALWRDFEDFDHQFAGIALTVRYVPTNRPYTEWVEEGDYKRWRDQWYTHLSGEPFIDSIGAGTVVVIDNGGDGDTGSVGSNNSMVWTERGAVAIVASGGVRDTDEIIKQRIPVYFDFRKRGRGIRPGRNELESVNAPVVVGGVLVRPGDVVVGDGDGVLVVPRAQAEAVALAARDELELDKAARRALYERLGLPPDRTVRQR